jgi:hypothetical protein
LAAIALAVRQRPGSPTATFDGQAIVAGRTVSLALGGNDLTFSDGSRLSALASSEVQLSDLHPGGARVQLVRGTVAVDVVHRDGTAWSVGAGPYVVHVTGTKFSLSWTEETGAFELEMQSGEVLVTGGTLARARRVRTGERLHVEASLSNERPAASAGATSSAAPPATSVAPATLPAGRHQPEEPATARGAPSSSSSPQLDSADWREFARKGDYKKAWELVSAAGFDAIGARSDMNDLVMLCDVAHFTMHVSEAKTCFESVRRRFPGLPDASTAAFQLGQLSATQKEAANWFGTYLREQPSGRLAREARGRLMEALVALGDLPGAREQANRYLTLYPDGAHAQFARSILRR